MLTGKLLFNLLKENQILSCWYYWLLKDMIQFHRIISADLLEKIKVNRKRKILILIPAVILLVTIIVINLDSTAFTEPYLDEHGAPVKGSIASLEKIKLSGVKQSVLIRGKDTSNPVFLYVHGGPGYSEIPLIRHYNKDLEKHFTVVTWDQRGTGKSFLGC